MSTSFKRGDIVKGVKSGWRYEIISQRLYYYDTYVPYYWVKNLDTGKEKRAYEHDLEAAKVNER